MGSSGKKRKGRQHLPKVGTPQEVRYAEGEKRREAGASVGLRGPWGIILSVVGIVAIVVFMLLIFR